MTLYICMCLLNTHSRQSWAMSTRIATYKVCKVQKQYFKNVTNILPEAYPFDVAFFRLAMILIRRRTTNENGFNDGTILKCAQLIMCEMQNSKYVYSLHILPLVFHHSLTSNKTTTFQLKIFMLEKRFSMQEK